MFPLVKTTGGKVDTGSTSEGGEKSKNTKEARALGNPPHVSETRNYAVQDQKRDERPNIALLNRKDDTYEYDNLKSSQIEASKPYEQALITTTSKASVGEKYPWENKVTIYSKV